MTRLLNFGCGHAYHPGWINLDAAPADSTVIAWDVSHGFPFADGDFDAVYGSHVVEHLEPPATARLLRECHRILKPRGIVRVVVPDLEVIARIYLDSLAAAMAGEARAQQRYDWIMLELYDQAVRTYPGGAMGEYLRRPMDKDQEAFLRSRIGYEAAVRRPGGRWTRRRLATAVRALRSAAAGAASALFLGPEGSRALREGLFRRSGEVHRWMYDRFSMKRALQDAGFDETRVCSADVSAIPDFARYGLERSNGLERKPDSLYVEARKSRRS